MNNKEIESGITGYKYEQKRLLRLLRMYGPFSETDFDRWFIGREYKKGRRMKLFPRGIDGDSFILGMGINGGNMWAENLELMQYMIMLGKIDANIINGEVVYSLP